MPASMCDLARKLPLLVGGLLEREKLLKRGRFREETMTDIFTGALAAFAGRNLVIEYPVELDTGGDIDLRFWHEGARSRWQLLVPQGGVHVLETRWSPWLVETRVWWIAVDPADTKLAVAIQQSLLWIDTHPPASV